MFFPILFVFATGVVNFLLELWQKPGLLLTKSILNTIK